MGDKMNDMNITQFFYNNMASQYDKLFLDWETTTHEQAAFLSRIFRENGFDDTSQILDCACGIGTQAITLESAVKSITNQMKHGGMFIASIRDYDMLLKEKPTYSAPYIHKTDKGQRVSFQTWEWDGDNYKFIQYIIDDEGKLQISKFECEYRATRREELTNLLLSNGCSEVIWRLPEETGFYQPVVIAKK